MLYEVITLYHDKEIKDRLAKSQSFGDWIEKVVDLNAIMRVCVAAGGTITGEHGVGADKQKSYNFV